MRTAVLAVVAAAATLAVPDRASKEPAELRVIEASRFVGGRFARIEWIDTATSSTRQESAGGPWTSDCPLTVVANGRVTSWRRDCAPLARERFRRGHVWYTADVLLAQRLLAAGIARIEGSVTVGGAKAVRVALPPSQNPLMPISQMDVDPDSMLPLRLIYSVDGRTWEEPVEIRRLPRTAFPRDFFEP